MIRNVIEEVLNEFNKGNMELKDILYNTLSKYEIIEKKCELEIIENSWENELKLFLARKKLEGRSDRTIELYNLHLSRMLSYINKSTCDITETDLFMYLSLYKEKRKISNVYLDNIRLVFSSFFSWLNNKGYITNNPAAGLDKIKIEKKIKKPFSEIELENIRMYCRQQRDRAIIEVLYSTGVRVSELVNLNISDIDFSNMEVIVKGKGNKERTVYLTPLSCMHLKKYISDRNDDNDALFVSIKKPNKRLGTSGIEEILRRISRKTNIVNVHPHRFRRTLATNILNKGMPIEEVKELLGHTKIDTTMIYCKINKENVRHSHRKFMSA